MCVCGGGGWVAGGWGGGESQRLGQRVQEVGRCATFVSYCWLRGGVMRRRSFFV